MIEKNHKKRKIINPRSKVFAGRIDRKYLKIISFHQLVLYKNKPKLSKVELGLNKFEEALTINFILLVTLLISKKNINKFAGVTPE